MAATYAGSAIVCTGTTSIDGPLMLTGIINNATTSFTITRGGNTVISGGAGATFNDFKFRSSGPITVTVVGGGSVTLHLQGPAVR